MIAEPTEPVNLGKVAYDAYGDSRDWKVVSGAEMPTWEDQDEALKKAWEDAAQAVHEEVLKGML